MTNTQETGWTRGEWHVVRYGDGDSLVICLDEAGNKRVAFMAVPGCRDHLERKAKWREIKANARLIAAAPCLAEVCARALEVIDDQLGGDFPELLADMRAALSKANGHG
jgi:hypothetical protein